MEKLEHHPQLRWMSQRMQALSEPSSHRHFTFSRFCLLLPTQGSLDRAQEVDSQAELDKQMEPVTVYQAGPDSVLVQGMLFQSWGATSENPLEL